MKISGIIYRSCLVIAVTILAGVMQLQGGILTDLPTIRVNGKVMYYYDAQSGDNIYTIADKLGISVEQIRANNPSVADGVRPRMRLLFPSDIATSDEGSSAGPLTHVVKKGESVYGIAHEYGMTVDELLALNPMASQGLRAGQRLLLKSNLQLTAGAASRGNAGTSAGESVAEAEGEFTAVIAETPSGSEQDPLSPDAKAADEVNEEPVDIAVILPFMLSEEKINHQTQLYTEFYKGFLLAATEENQGGRTPIRIHAFDSSSSVDSIRVLMKMPQMQEMKMIIVPENPAQIEIVAADAPPGAMMLNLFSVRDSSYLKIPGMIQANIPSGEMLNRAVEGFIARFNDTMPVFLTRKNGRTDKSEFIDLLKSALSMRGIVYRTVHFDGYLADADLEEFDPLAAKYVFIPASGNRDEFARIIPALKVLSGKAVDTEAVQLFGYPEWAAFRSDQFKELCDINTTIYSRYLPAERMDSAREFNHLFSENFGGGLIENQLPVLGILGYDAGRYVIEAMRKKAATGEFPTDFDGIQSALRLSLAEDGGGLYNSCLFLIRYIPGEMVTYQLVSSNRTLMEQED